MRLAIVDFRYLTIAILIEKGEGLLEFSNLLFSKLISHGACIWWFALVSFGSVTGFSLRGLVKSFYVL